MRKTVLSGLKATSSKLIPTSSFTGRWSQPSGIGSLCILGCHIRENGTTGSQRVVVVRLLPSLRGRRIYLRTALQVRLAKSFDRPCIQRLGRQVVSHMVRHVDQPDERGLETPNPEVFHQTAIAMLVHVHRHKQNLSWMQTQKISCDTSL